MAGRGLRLYHFTSEGNWQSIDAAGEIISLAERTLRDPESRPLEWSYPGEPDQDDWLERFVEVHEGSVWLTDHHLPPLGRGWPIRIEVQVSDARRWRRYACKLGVPSSFAGTLGEDSDNEQGRYYVVERSIPRAEWVVVERLPTEVVDMSRAGLAHLLRTFPAPEVLWRREPQGQAA